MKISITTKYQFALAIILTALGYWIDTDPPYPYFLDTVREFIIITIILFVVIKLISFCLGLLSRVIISD